MVDENSGGGLFGLDARIVLHAPQPGDSFAITGKNPGPGDWWQISYEGRTASVYGPLVAATNAHNVEVVSPP